MMIGIEDVEAARARIAPHIRTTPLYEAIHAREALPVAASVVLKLELQQVTGSFKARGAMNRLLGATSDEIAAGIVTAFYVRTFLFILFIASLQHFFVFSLQYLDFQHSE